MLDGDHARLMEAVLPVCHTYGLALAGGYAVKAHGLVDRPSEDIDFATAGTAPLDEIMTALADAYRKTDCEVRILDVDARKGHLLVTFPHSATYRVDVLKEPLNRPLVMMEFGPVIGLSDAVALKMNAFYDRALPRDLLDVHGASACFTGPDLISLCKSVMDDEFSPEVLRDQLCFAASYPDESFQRYGIQSDKIAEAKRWALEWSQEIGLDMLETEPWSDPGELADEE